MVYATIETFSSKDEDEIPRKMDCAFACFTINKAYGSHRLRSPERSMTQRKATIITGKRCIAALATRLNAQDGSN